MLKVDYFLVVDGVVSLICKVFGIIFKNLGYDCDWFVIDVLFKC